MFAFVGTGVGIAYLSADIWAKGFLLMDFVFTVGSAFTFAKTIRDDHENQKKSLIVSKMQKPKKS